MRTIISGSRSIVDPSLVERAVTNSGFNVTEVVSCGAAGVEQSGECWASERYLPVTHVREQLSWVQAHEIMVEYADALVAIWDGESIGTKALIEEASKKGLHVFVYVPDAC